MSISDIKLLKCKLIIGSKAANITAKLNEPARILDLNCARRSSSFFSLQTPGIKKEINKRLLSQGAIYFIEELGDGAEFIL